MKRLDRLFLRLYPASWRARYGDELEALIEDSGSSFTTKMNLLAGAIRMQFSLPSFPKLAIALGVGGMLAGLGISFLVTPQYVSTASMQLGSAYRGTPAANKSLTEHLMQLEQEILSRTSLSQIIKDPRLDLYARDRVHTPLEDVIERMRTKDIGIRILPATSNKYAAFSVSFIYSDRLKAQQTVQALMTRFMDANLAHERASADLRQQYSVDEIDRLEVRIAAIEKRLGMPSEQGVGPDISAARDTSLNLDVLDPPSLPITPISPNRATFTATGAGTGLACAILIALFRRKPAPMPFPAQTA